MFRSRLTPAAFAAAAALSCAQAAEPLDEIIVTATFREQTLIDVPASVTVLGVDATRAAGRQHFEDVLTLVPNLHWAGGTSRPRYFQVRGIGEREQYEGAPNPSVGFLIDDIDFSGIGMAATLFDIERVEVLRGPQGTRYGANALAGLVVMRSHDPEETFGYMAEAGIGEYGGRSAGFALTGPIESLRSSWRIAVQQQRSDGFMRNAFLGRDDTNDRDELTGRFKWRWRPSERTTLDVTALHADLDNGYDAWAIDNSRVTLSDRPGEDSQRATGLSARLTSTTASGYTVTAIASYLDSKSTNSFDADWGNAQSWAPYVYDYFQRADRDRETASFELRLASDASDTPGEMAWLVGVYALQLDETGRDRLIGVYEDPFDPSWNGTTDDWLRSEYRGRNIAVFGQVDQRLNDRWRWSLGLRAEQRDADYEDEGLVDESEQRSDLSARDSMIGGQISLSADLSDASAAYVALSRGYKAGGFNLGSIPEEAREFDPEYLTNLEVGLKSELGGGRGFVDAALFYQWRRDLQVRTGRQADPMNPGTYVFVTDNLRSGYNAGFEASLRYALTPSLTVGGTLGLLRTKASGGLSEDGDPVPSREQAHAPEYSVSMFADWRHASGIRARVDVSAKDNFYFDVPTDHDQRSHAYSITNLRVGYEREHWSAYLWMKNLFDERYPIRGFYFYNEPPFLEKRLYTQLGEPRQLGVTVSWRMR